MLSMIVLKWCVKRFCVIVIDKAHTSTNYHLVLRHKLQQRSDKLQEVCFETCINVNKYKWHKHQKSVLSRPYWWFTEKTMSYTV